MLYAPMQYDRAFTACECTSTGSDLRRLSITAQVAAAGKLPDKLASSGSPSPYIALGTVRTAPSEQLPRCLSKPWQDGGEPTGPHQRHDAGLLDILGLKSEMSNDETTRAHMSSAELPTLPSCPSKVDQEALQQSLRRSKRQSTHVSVLESAASSDDQVETLTGL